MRFAGIDIGSQTHAVAVVDEAGQVLLKPQSANEDAEGYGALVEASGSSHDVLVALETTGHYGRNLFAHLAAAGFQLALLNPVRIRRFAAEALARTKDRQH